MRILRLVGALTLATVLHFDFGEARAHGPQIQITADAGKIVTRRLIGDGPYGATLTGQTSVYVMPVAQTSGVWYSHPSSALDPILHIPAFTSGPGLAYGYGYDATTNPAPFPLGSQFVWGFTAGLKTWSGAAFVDAGATELEAFRGSGVNLVTARTSDAGPPANIKFPSVISPMTGVSFAVDHEDTHTSVSFRFLGDGVSATSALPDGIYLASLQLGSTSAGLQTSDPFYFVLSKNGSASATAAAVAALGVDGSRVQSLFVPEPGTAAIAGAAMFVISIALRRRTP